MIRNTYMTTGEFAKLMKVSKHTLFHYDDIKLFCPEIVTDNDYRYYSIYQMETFDTILLLKDTGMSLKEIKDFMDHRSPEHFLKMFDTRKKELDLEIQKLLTMKAWLNQRKEKIEYAQTCDISSVSSKQHAVRYYLYGELEDSSDKTLYSQINHLVLELEDSGYTDDYDIAYMKHRTDVAKGTYDCYDNTLLLMQRSSLANAIRTLPAGDYLTAYHVGHWDSIGEAYKRLLTYERSHHIMTEGDYLEYYIIDNFTSDNIDTYVTEISVRIASDSIESIIETHCY